MPDHAVATYMIRIQAGRMRHPVGELVRESPVENRLHVFVRRAGKSSSITGKGISCRFMREGEEEEEVEEKGEEEGEGGDGGGGGGRGGG